MHAQKNNLNEVMTLRVTMFPPISHRWSNKTPSVKLEKLPFNLFFMGIQETSKTT